MNIPSGHRYELCRSVHAEANAIISASRKEMLGATLYLVGKNYNTGDYVVNASCCDMCKRLVINAGIIKVTARITKTVYNTTDVERWIYYGL